MSRADARLWHAWRGSGVAVFLTVVVASAGPGSAQIAPLATPAPGADQTLERDALLAFEPLSLEDVLRRLVGVAVSRRGGVGSLEYLDVQGTPSGRIQLSLDGIDLLEPELAFPRLAAIPIAAVQRIQVFSSTDPVRIEVWTRRHTSDVAATEIDLARGDVETRVRRLQLLLPPRWWWVGMRYDEWLRGPEDFRPQPRTLPPDALGAYDNRGRSLVFGFERPGGEGLRVLLADDFDNAHGSYESVDETTGANRVLGSLRWWRPLAGWDLVADVSQQAWERARGFASGTQAITETHAQLGVDVTRTPATGWGGAVRLRAGDVDGTRTGVAPGIEQHRHQRYDGEAQWGHAGSLAWNAWAGVHHRTDVGTEWSTRLHLQWQRGAWVVQAQGGRGATFAGWGEIRATADDGRRSGVYAGGGVRRAGERTTFGVSGSRKHQARRSERAPLLFPLLGEGPEDLTTVAAEAAWQSGSASTPWGLDAHVAWTPQVTGARGGIAVVQAEASARVAARQLFQGDLQVALLLRWRFETEREFTDAVVLAPLALGDARLDFRVLQRLHVYWDVQNLADLGIETHPGVLLPRRTSLIGVRVELFD